MVITIVEFYYEHVNNYGIFDSKNIQIRNYLYIKTNLASEKCIKQIYVRK